MMEDQSWNYQQSGIDDPWQSFGTVEKNWLAGNVQGFAKRAGLGMWEEMLVLVVAAVEEGIEHLIVHMFVLGMLSCA